MVRVTGWNGSAGRHRKAARVSGGAPRLSPRWAVVVSALVLPLAAAAVTAPAASAATYTVTATIKVATLPAGPIATVMGVAVDPATDTIYTTCAGCGTLAVVDGATNTVTDTMTVSSPLRPVGIAVDPATDTVYVAALGAVLVIDGATDTVTNTIPTTGSAYAVAVDPATDTVYVTNRNDDTVSVIDGATSTVTATIGVGVSPDGIAVDPATGTIYVGNSGDPASVSVIDGATNTVTATIPGIGGFGIAVNPATDTVYATNLGPALSVIDGATNTVTATVTVGNFPEGVAVDPGTDTVYVANNRGTSSETPGTMSVIDGTTNTVVATVVVGAYPIGVAVNPANDAVYVTNGGDGTVSVINGPTDNDLARSTPGDITADATGPGGSPVTYTLPTVSDPDDASVPAASCSPASGSEFTIGTTTVTCTAADPDDTNSPVSTSFTVTVNGAPAQLDDLYQDVQGVGPGTSLSDKVQQAQSDLAAGDTAGTCGVLGAFIHEVQAQTGKSIPAAVAADLIADAQQIQAVLSC
jgi:YVTN family beta-propeller protein